jgi:2-iminobutanoate/2-iminopropanoate deaminase
MRNKLSWVILAAAIATSGSGVCAQETDRKVILTPTAPNALGPYSQAIRVGKTLYVSGETAIEPKTNQVISDGTIEEQTRRVLDNVAAILAAGGLTMDHVVSTTVFLTDINEFDRMNQVYATYFSLLHRRKSLFKLPG